MKLFLIMATMALGSMNLNAQLNEVKNPDFSQRIYCPDSTVPNPWGIVGWSIQGSPVPFDSCSDWSETSAPYNRYGYADGDKFVGLRTFKGNPSPGQFYPDRISQNLNTALVGVYDFSITYSMAESTIDTSQLTVEIGLLEFATPMAKDTSWVTWDTTISVFGASTMAIYPGPIVNRVSLNHNDNLIFIKEIRLGEHSVQIGTGNLSHSHIWVPVYYYPLKYQQCTICGAKQKTAVIIW